MLDLRANVFKQSKIHTMACNTFKISYTSTFTRQNTMTKGALFLLKPLKTRKFNNIEDSWIQNLKHGPTIEQTGIYDIYDASKIIANYNQPLPENDSTIRDTLSFPDIFKRRKQWRLRVCFLWLWVIFYKHHC